MSTSSSTRLSAVRSTSARSETLLRAIADLERLKAQTDGLQALLEVEFRRERVRAQEEAGVPREHLGRGVAEEIALARGVSPSKAGNQLAVRRVLVESMPQMFARVMKGDVASWSAEQAAQVALVLDDPDRALLDAELAPRAGDLSPAAVKGAARRIADRLDQYAAMRRLERAESERHVSIRPVADGMVRLSALLPAHAGVAVLATLTKLAASARAGGDARGKGQLMADLLVERITGRADPAEVPIELQLLMTDRTLLAGGSDAALLEGHSIPAEAARALALRGARAAAEPARYVRRLFTDPASGRLTGMDTRRRAFTGAVRAFINARDQVCRIAHCGAPIRDIDHVTRYADGGETSLDNGVGLCQRHNLVKEMPGWRAELEQSDRGRALRLRTPSGLTLSSPEPDLHALTGPPFGATGRSPGQSARGPDQRTGGASTSPPRDAPHTGPARRPAEARTNEGRAGDLTDAELRDLLRETWEWWGLTA